MKRNLLSIIAIILSVIAIAVSAYALHEVRTTTPGSNKTEYSVDKDLIGDWSGTNDMGETVLMRILEDSAVVIEDHEYRNSERVNLYIGHIENNVIVFERVCKRKRDSDYVSGSLLDEYLNSPSSVELEEYYLVRNYTKVTNDSLLVNYGIVNSNGEVTTSFVRQ